MTTKRQFLKAALSSPLLLTTSPVHAESWQNWSGAQQSNSQAILYPDSESSLISAIKSAKGSVRAFGGGHSFSPLVPTDGTLISLEAMNGLRHHDTHKQQATLAAGTRIAQIGPLLAGINQGLLNEADINMQSIAGAISTATHGTGRQLQCYSATVQDIRMVLSSGEVLTVSPQKDKALFEAARVGLGSIGIFSEITLQNRAAYRLRETVKVMNLPEASQFINDNKDKHRHIEFFAFPLGGKAILKYLDITTDAITPPEKPSIDENEILEFAADTVRKYPWTNKWWQKLVGAFVDNSERVDDSYKIYASSRAVGFNEMEYAVPAEQGLNCFMEVVAAMKQHNLDVFFPIEFRYVAADDCWLSPFYQRASATISVHQYFKQDYRKVFNIVEPIFWKYQGRPHWGKLHTLTAKNLRALYPQFDAFLAVRQKVDPKGKFLNNHTRQLFLG